MRLWYFPLEPLASRYTEQLCDYWIPDAIVHAIHKSGTDISLRTVDGVRQGDDIKHGSVLDSTGRSIYAMSQVTSFLKLMDVEEVRDGDTVFLQDFWTPGFESIPYACQQRGIDLRLYSYLWAQSVDEYDFTYPMRHWMRGFEKGMDSLHSGIFVASTLLKDLLRDAGFTSPIHVVGLPIWVQDVQRMMPVRRDSKRVIYTSRLDAEKNPMFMLQVARRFLTSHQDWSWLITSSRKEPPMADSVREEIASLQRIFPERFSLTFGISKEQYYRALKESAIQFNSAFQDWVAWTLLEACVAGCDICYPDFRSFPECVPNSRRYEPWNFDSALEVLNRCIKYPRKHYGIADVCSSTGRNVIADVLINGADREYNIWRDLPVTATASVWP